uniref:Uncharacterized protein n=1 Tax=Grammatophora oceanica TaxID=210454 RepID=A0A7S1V5D9_9STRA|mmetsp:Transcript_37098/g.55257  ORF Transcript_37098/g.55257 Transcript_37098/m.55257 type:complete len:310 (+) Transcript_37098:80-1009(+)
MSVTTLNYLNLLAYIANVAVTFGVGLIGGIFDLPSIGEQSIKYQTLITPAGYAFFIWAVIFFAQAAFTIVQLLPSLAGTSLVQNGVSYNYIGVVVMQILWVLAFLTDAILLSEIFMLGILFFLASIVVRQYNIKQPGGWKEYVLLKFPFLVHCGWIIVASLVNTSVLLVFRATDTDLQFYVALASLLGALVIANLLLTCLSRPIFVIPMVVAWASVGIFVELLEPLDLLAAWFGDEAIVTIQYLALIVAIIIVLAVLLKAYLQLRNRTENERKGTSGNTGVARWSTGRDAEQGYVRADEKGRGAGGWFR